MPAYRASHIIKINKINAHSLFNFQDAKANSDIQHEQSSEEQDITNVNIVPCEVTSPQFLGGILAVNVEK